MASLRVIQGKSTTDSHHAWCDDCLRRGRRGGQASFKASATKDLFDFVNRHKRHGNDD